jgi:hypothetical protein
MKRLLLLLLVALPVVAGCRKAPSESEREWEEGLRATLPPGWQVLVVIGDPKKNRLVCWFEAPGPHARTCRVELRVAPRPGAPDEREWTVLVHPPVQPRAQEGSVTFTVADDGAGPVEVAPGPGNDPAAVEAARPLAEEAARQVSGLRLF